MKLKVGSRESRLAVAQTQLIMNAIRRAHPEIELELVTMKTTGDRILDRTLDQVGGKGLFVKELDAALLSGAADLTVHSMKDLPMEQDDRLPIVGVSQREDPRDALVFPAGSDCLSFEKPIGCSSARRRIQLQKLYPGCRVEPVRGNVITRLEKLDRGEFGALVLASAGLRREKRIGKIFSIEEMLPAAGQGALALQCRAETDPWFLQCVCDPLAAAAVAAERSFVQALDGGCSSPVAAYATVEGGRVTLTGLLPLQNGGYRISRLTDDITKAQALGRELARRMKEKERKA